jgi:antitoxin CptB
MCELRDPDHDTGRIALYITRPGPVRVFGVGAAVTTGTQISSEGLDPRRRRLLFRAWHRGIREMDLIIGRFADRHLAALNETELDTFESWLEVPDQQMFAWVNGSEEAPAAIDSALFQRLRDFHTKGSIET